MPIRNLPRVAIAVAIAFGILTGVHSAEANLPGGGDGTGANVTLVNNNDGTVTLGNGVVTALIKVSTAQILQLTYLGVQVTDGNTAGNGAIYWQGGSGGNDTLTTVVDPSANGGDWAMIRLDDFLTNNASNADAYRYFALFRGSPGLYVCEDMERTTNAPSGGADLPSLTGKFDANLFQWLGQDTGRFMRRQDGTDAGIAVNNGPKEVSLLTSGGLAGQFECKYDYSGDLGTLHFMGWATTNRPTNFGLWLIHPSREYFSSGPSHPEIIGQFAMINCTFKSVHFGFSSDLNFTNGQAWSRVCGPVFYYFNQAPPGTANPQFPLYADAAAQAGAEAGAWPYSWFSDPHYVQASGRGTVTGKMVINDSGNPNASAANLWVGVAQQPPTPTVPAPTDFQQWAKSYQFWTRTDTNGNFSIPDVIAGTNYTLFAFGPGALGQFQSQSLPGASPTVAVSVPAAAFSVTVNGGQTNALGAVTWTPARVGMTVFEIGVPDRDSTEFRHGQDYWHGDFGSVTNFPVNWAPFMDYGLDFPGGVVNYTNGISRWSADWDYAAPTVIDPATGNLNGSIQNIYFNLPSTPGASSQASLYLAFAASYQGATIVQVNGVNVAGSTGFFPYYSSSASANDAMIRMHSHGIFGDWRTNFAGNLLHQGQNVIQLNMRKGGYFANGNLYDYLRLELSDYVPPAPAGLAAIAGNGVVVLNWPASSGATSYAVWRSTTSGGGYTAMATNVPGPVVGSDVPDATWADNTVANGTTYYYIVKAVNPNGSSAASVQATATPSASTPPPPAAPTGPAVTPGNLQATLTWNAPAGAATYTIRRTVLTYGAVVTGPDGSIPTNLVNGFVTATNYTDTGLLNNVTYAYTVTAANANGASVASAPVAVTPRPAPSATPTGLSATVLSNQVNLSWNPVPGAENYSLQRAASIAGPYSTVTVYPTASALYSDAGLSYNTTYYYEVASANLAGASTNSAPVAVTTTPSPPSPLTAIPGDAQVYLDWGDSAGATQYVLQRSTTNGGPYSTVITTTNTSRVDAGLANGVTYYYVVYAVGPAGASPLSAQAAATPGGTAQMIKSDTTTMNTAADWNGVSPATNEIGIFNDIISAANEAALALGGDVGVGGIIFSNNLNGPVSVGAGNTLTLGGAGLDLGGANQSVTFNNAINLGAQQVWSVANNQSLTVNGAWAGGSNTVIKTGGGTLNLGTTVNDAGANLQVNAGVVQANAGSGITISLNGGTFNVNAYDSNPVNVLSGGIEQNVGGNRTWAGNLAGSGPLTVIATSTHTWSGNNTNYYGTITLQGSGALRLSSLTAVSAGTAYNFNGGTMNANAAGMFNLGALSGSGTLNTVSGENFSIGALGTSATFSGMVAGAGYLQKVGAGTLTLTAANTYSGGTFVNGGILQVNNSTGSGTGSGPVWVYAGTTLCGNGTVAGATGIATGGTLAPGSGGIGTLTFSNALTLWSGCTNVFQLGNSPLTNDLVNVLGALTNGGTLVVTNIGTAALTNGDRFKLFNAASYRGSFAAVALPPLAGNLAWNTNALATNGTIFVVTLTSPQISSVQFSGNDLLMGGSGGTANWPYAVLSATNLAGAWTAVTTNFLDGDGGFTLTLTNAVDPTRPAVFYKLQLR